MAPLRILTFVLAIAVTLLQASYCHGVSHPMADSVQSHSVKEHQLPHKYLLMNARDEVVGEIVRLHRRNEDLPTPSLPNPPVNTSKQLQTLASSSFPVGSPNLTVDQPWVKNGDLCNSHVDQTDSLLTHHFQDTTYVPTNDICTLVPGFYTWTLTIDYQLSFGHYLNSMEWGTKHANLALTRPCFVAGELFVVPATNVSRPNIFWNLLSGTYSIPISQANSPSDDPLSYLDKVLFPKMSRVWLGTDCANAIHYQDWEFFPELTPSESYVDYLCHDNYFAMYENAIEWKNAPAANTSVCLSWSPKTCAQRLAGLQPE